MPPVKAGNLVNGVVEEDLRAIRTVKAFVREGYEERRFGEVNARLRKAGSAWLRSRLRA